MPETNVAEVELLVNGGHAQPAAPVLPPFFGWHSVVNVTEWRLITFFQFLFCAVSLAQVALQKEGEMSKDIPLWVTLAHVVLQFPLIIGGPAWSPFGLAARSIACRFPVRPSPCQPKVFAAAAHFVTGCLSFGMWFLVHDNDVWYSLPWMLVMFSFLLLLDAVTSFCPACFVWAYVVAPCGLAPKSILANYKRARSQAEVDGVYARWVKKEAKEEKPAPSSEFEVNCSNGLCELKKKALK